MPRLRAQGTTPSQPLGGSAEAESPVIVDNSTSSSALPEQPAPRRQQEQAQEQLLRCLPNSLSRELKLGAIGWRGGCFCCPAIISFGQCMAGLWQGARKPGQSAESLVHWGLNATKFLYEAGQRAEAGRILLLHAGYPSLVPQVLSLTEEVLQSTALTPEVPFTQVFATGGKQLPLTTTPQLVLLGLLAQLTASPAGLTAVAASPDLIPALVRALSASTDDRFRSLALQTIAEWLAAAEDADELPAAAGGAAAGAGQEAGAEAREEAGEEGAGGARRGRRRRGRGGGAAAAAAPAAAAPPFKPLGAGEALDAADQVAVRRRLLDAGLVAAVVDVMQRSVCAPVVRDACAVMMGLMAPPGTGLGSGSSRGRRGGPAGHSAGPKGHGGAVAGLTAARLPPGMALEGPLRCRARAEGLQAGLVPAALAALSRRPSQQRYWLSVNWGVSGVRLRELQWWLLILMRACLLPERPLFSPTTTTTTTTTRSPAASSTAGDDAGPETGTSTTTSSSGATPTPTTSSTAPGGVAPGGVAPGGVAPEVAAERDRLRQAAAEAVLGYLGFESWWKAAEEGGEEGEGEDPAAGAAAAESETAAGQKAVAEAEAAEGRDAEELSATQKALKLLFVVLRTAATSSVCLPDGLPLAELPARERNATPDWRAVQRDRIRLATEEARAAQAQASAAAAVDVLSMAVAQM